MIVLDFVLLIIGIVAVTASFLRVKETENQALTEESGHVASAGNVWSEKDEKRIQEQMELLLEESRDTVVQDAEEQMGHLSNEKIIAVSEYGDQVLDKIQKNHSEVVFLYNMLNEKENEIKEVIHLLDKKKADLTDFAAKTSYELKTVIKEAEAKKSKLSVQDLMNITKEKPVSEPETAPAPQKKQETEKKAEQPQLPIKEQKQTSGKEAVRKSMEKKVTEKKQETAANTEKSTLAQFHYFQVPEESTKEPEDTPKNYNDIIVDMYKEGRSILDISKELEIGQGEVKFVIDLYAHD